MLNGIGIHVKNGYFIRLAIAVKTVHVMLHPFTSQLTPGACPIPSPNSVHSATQGPGPSVQQPRKYEQPAVHVLMDPAFPYGEDLLQYVWEQRLFEQTELSTTDGLSVEVLKAGRIQHHSGPDLVDALVRVDGQVWAGNVEVHVRSSEWNAHGHQFDPAYDNVILHVVFEHDSEVRTRNGTVPPTVELMNRISIPCLEQHQTLMMSKEFVPCARQIVHVDQGRIGVWLERVLVERLERKSAEVVALYLQLAKDPAETFYHVLARAFGLKVNVEPFGMLAHAMPLRTLLKYHDDPLRTEALLFGQAGLLRVDHVDEYPRQLQAEHAALAGLHGLRPGPVAAWKFARLRPMNFPTIRIAQLAQLLMRKDGINALLEARDLMELHRVLDIGTSPYWNDRYTFDRPSALREKRLGRAGSDHLIINAVVPTLFALGRLQGRPELRDRALGLLEALPAESNTVLREWAAIGQGANSAARGQALLELRNSYCARRRCLSCGVGNHLLKRSVG